MKAFFTRFAGVTLLVISVFMFDQILFCQDNVEDVRDSRKIWEASWPWADSVLVNDSLKVNISDDFTEAEKQAIRNGMDKWNAAGCQPPLAEDGATAPVQVEKADLPAGTCGETTVYDRNPKDGFAESAVIKIDPSECTTVSVEETATHEFGHVLRLDHTNGAADAMKPAGTNGSNGGLSKHDSAELKLVNAMYTFDLPRDEAEQPMIAIMPGEPSVIAFDLSGYYPPEVLLQTAAMVIPSFDDDMYVEMVDIYENMLIVSLFPEPAHWPGTFYLWIDLLPPLPYEPVQFLGYFYISSEPIPPVEFECPMEIYEEAGQVFVNWTEGCTYPFDFELTSTLVVDEEMTLSPKNGENYILELEPGEHTFDLFVDDFQVNSATSKATFLVTGIDSPNLNDGLSFVVSPNPFTEYCNINCSLPCEVRIYDLCGKQVHAMSGSAMTWKPAPNLHEGIYLIRLSADDYFVVRKVIYCK